MARCCPACRGGVPADEWACAACGWRAEERRGHLCLSPEADADDPGFVPDAYDRLKDVEEGSFWFRARNQIILLMLRAHFPGARRVLEIGCGTGYVLNALAEALPAAHLIGTELHHGGLDAARARVPARVELMQLDARAMPYRDEFDLVGAFDVIEHIDEDERVLAELFRATAPGGGLLLTVPQHMFLWGETDEFSHHKRRYSRGELVAKVRAAGFEVARTTSFVTLLFPMLLLSRLMLALRGPGEFDPDREVGLPGPVDHVLEAIMTLERQLVRLGLDLPFGGSLLLVARRPA